MLPSIRTSRRTTSAPGLRAAQEWLASRILAPAEPATQELEELLVPPAAGALTERLALHRGGYPARIEAALVDTYPAIAHLIGAGALHGLAHRYVRSLDAAPWHPTNLNDVGGAFATYLARDLLTADLPFLPDLAALEWAIAAAFHARDETPFAAAELAGWGLEDFGGARLRFQPSLALVRSAWPIVDLWEARETPIEEIDIALVDRPQMALVQRCGLRVACRVVEPLEAECVEGLRRGLRLGEVAASLEGRCPADAVAGWFAAWSAAGLITECRRAG